MVSLASLPLAILLAAAAPPGIEGLYRLGGKDSVTLKVAPGKTEGLYAAVAVAATGDWHSQQLRQTVLELRRTGENEFRGRANAYHARASKDMAAWLEVTKADLSPSGDLRCTIKIPDEGSIQLVYKRLAGRIAGNPPAEGVSADDPEPQPVPPPDEGDLVGLWRAPSGDVTRYARAGDAYTGYVARLSREKEGFGFRVGEESIRLTRRGKGYYVGQVKVKSEGGADVWWEAIEVTVSKDALKFTRLPAGGGRVEGTAIRVSML